MLNFLIPQASTFADDIDNLLLLVTVVVGFWFFATMGMFFYLIWTSRRRPGVKAEYITGKEPHLKRWITIPHALIIVCDVVLVVGAVKVWYDVKQVMPEPADTIHVVGQQWAWTFTHSGPDGELHTDDDIVLIDELHVEIDKVYHFELESPDVLHSFSIPSFRLKQDIIPGRVVRGWFEPNRLGEYDIQCAEMCGIGHGIMGARIHVESAADYAAWQQRNTAVASK